MLLSKSAYRIFFFCRAEKNRNVNTNFFLNYTPKKNAANKNSCCTKILIFQLKFKTYIMF